MLSKIQSLIKAPKGQFNSFGKYKYRSCEDIIEAIKPVINQLGFYLILTDEIIEERDRYYVKATATISNGTETYSATAYAREDECRKGMDGSQITGSSSSYARKYALCGLFALDDTKDPDATNFGKDEPTDEERQLLRNLVYGTDLIESKREQVFDLIDKCNNYQTYQKLKNRLEYRQKPIDQIVNPTQKDISNHLKKSVK